MDKVIYLTRHAQAEHNVAEDYTILDAKLTPLGRQQSKKLNEATRDTVQKDVDLVASSPLRRTMSTTLDGYPHAVERLGGKKNILLIPQAQECNDYPCDTGSPRSVLEKDPEYKGLDFSPLTDDWDSKQGIYAANVKALQARARYVRRLLRERPEKRIVLVAHGDILRYIVYGRQNGTPWANAEVRKYTFKSEDDEDAALVQIDTEAKEGRNEPTSSSNGFDGQAKY